MEIVYKSPNEQWVIVREPLGDWTKLFGYPLYTVRQFSDKKFSENANNNKDDISNFVLMHQAEKLETAFRWLRYIKVISSDEMKFNIKKFNSLGEDEVEKT